MTLELGVKDSFGQNLDKVAPARDGGDSDDRSRECIDQLRQSYCLPSLLSTPTGLKGWKVSFFQFQKWKNGLETFSEYKH